MNKDALQNQSDLETARKFVAQAMEDSGNPELVKDVLKGRWDHGVSVRAVCITLSAFKQISQDKFKEAVLAAYTVCPDTWRSGPNSGGNLPWEEAHPASRAETEKRTKAVLEYLGIKVAPDDFSAEHVHSEGERKTSRVGDPVNSDGFLSSGSGGGVYVVDGIDYLDLR